jgi:hypothetical protein
MAPLLVLRWFFSSVKDLKTKDFCYLATGILGLLFVIAILIKASAYLSSLLISILVTLLASKLV